MKTVLVTGTDTGVGKTWVTCLLVRHLLSLGFRTGAYKPVCSGAETNSAGVEHWNDVDALSQVCRTKPPVDLVCPQRFRQPVAPNVAAELEGRQVDDKLLIEGIEPWRPLVDWLVVEGAGGVLCPLSNQSTVMDLARKLEGPVIVVAANRLGVISHTRLTVEALQREGLSVSAVVLNEITPARDSEQDASRWTNAGQLQRWLPDVPLFHCDWKAPSLTSSLDSSLSRFASPGPSNSGGDFIRLLMTAAHSG